jgi:hypothetical protein
VRATAMSEEKDRQCRFSTTARRRQEGREEMNALKRTRPCRCVRNRERVTLPTDGARQRPQLDVLTRPPSAVEGVRLDEGHAAGERDD